MSIDSLFGNREALLDGAGSGGQTTEVQRKEADDASGGDQLPYRGEMERAFGQTFADVDVRLGNAQGSGRGAYTAYEGGRDVVAFDQTTPSREQVAHEMVHVTQRRRHGQGPEGLATTAAASEIEAREFAPRAAAGQSVEVVAAPAARVQRDDAVAQRIHDHLHGWITDNEPAALAELQNDPDRAGTVAAYNRLFGYTIWDDFQSNASGAVLNSAMVLLRPYMSLVDRLELCLGVNDDEAGILQIFRNASNADLQRARGTYESSPLKRFVDELDAADGYTAMMRIWPERPIDNLVWFLHAGNGWIWDDEGPVATAILRMTPAQRAELWNHHQHDFEMFNPTDLEQIRRMCVNERGQPATDEAALDARMVLATEGVGTDEEGVTDAVATAGARRDELAAINQQIERGVATDGTPLTDARRRALMARRDEIGNMGRLLTPATTADGSLDQSTFLGRVQGDMDAETVDSALATAHADPFQRTKQALLGTLSWTGDVDEEAVLRILRGLGEVTLAAGETMESIGEAEARRRRATSAAELINRLYADPELQPIFSALDAEETGYVSGLAAGSTFEAVQYDLREAFEGIDTDETAILRVLRDASAADRARLRNEDPPIIQRIRDWAAGGTFAEPFRQTLETGVIPPMLAIDEALGGDWDGTNVELVNEALSSLNAPDRARLRRGYLITHRHAATATDASAPADPADASAMEEYNTLHRRLENELSARDLDAALQLALDLPTVGEMTADNPRGRLDAAELMLYRQRERLQMTAGLTDIVSTDDDTAAAAHQEYEYRYNLVRADDDISQDEFAELVHLDTEFQARFRVYEDTANMAAQIAGTVAAVAAGVIVVICSGPAAPATATGVIAWISANSGLLAASAAAGAIAQVAGAETFGGDFHESLGTEGAREALSGAINGALAICGAALAERAAQLVGLTGPSLTAAIARSTAGAVESSVAGRAFARGALIGVIDGGLGGALGEMTMTMTDAQTYRHGVWNMLASYGAALLRGALMGAATGAVTGGLMEMAGGLLQQRGLRDVTFAMDAEGSRIRITGTPDHLSLHFGPATTDADLAAHVERIVAIRNAQGLLARARTAVTGFAEAPMNTVAGNAAHEAAKLPDMIEDRIRRLMAEGLAPGDAQLLEAEIEVLQANLDEFSRLARSGDLTPSTGGIARPDAPPGYPDPPVGHHYHRRGGEWDLQRNPDGADDITPMTVIADGTGPDGQPRYRIVDRASVNGGPVDPAIRRTDAGAIRDDAATLSDGARTESDRIATQRLAGIAERDAAQAEVTRLRTRLGLSEDDVSSGSIDATIARLRGERTGAELDMVNELARQRGVLAGARRDVSRASELLGNTAAMDIMQQRGAQHLWGNPTPPGRSGEFDFIYVTRNGDGTIREIFVVEAKGASSTLGTASFGGMAREQGSRAYMRGIAEGMRTYDGTELDGVLRRIAKGGDGAGPEVRYVLVQAPVDNVGRALPPSVSEFNITSATP